MKCLRSALRAYKTSVVGKDETVTSVYHIRHEILQRAMKPYGDMGLCPKLYTRLRRRYYYHTSKVLQLNIETKAGDPVFARKSSASRRSTRNPDPHYGYGKAERDKHVAKLLRKKNRRQTLITGYAQWHNQRYEEVKGSLSIFTPGSDAETESLKRTCKIVHQFDIPLVPETGGVLSDAKNFPRTEQNTRPVSLEERPIFTGVENLISAGKLPRVFVIDLPDVGLVLCSRDALEPGTVILMYTGRQMLSMNAPSGGEIGFNLVLDLLKHKFERDLDIVISPKTGGANVAHLASTCSPYRADYKNTNCILVAKTLKRPVFDDKGNVIPGEVTSIAGLYLVVVKSIKANGPIHWYYGPDYFDDPNLADVKWLTVKQLERKVRLHLIDHGELTCLAHEKEEKEENTQSLVYDTLRKGLQEAGVIQEMPLTKPKPSSTLFSTYVKNTGVKRKRRAHLTNKIEEERKVVQRKIHGGPMTETCTITETITQTSKTTFTLTSTCDTETETVHGLVTHSFSKTKINK